MSLSTVTSCQGAEATRSNSPGNSLKRLTNSKNWSRSDVSLSMPSARAWLGQEPCTFITTWASVQPAILSNRMAGTPSPILRESAGRGSKIGLELDLVVDAQELALLLEHCQKLTQILICAHEVASCLAAAASTLPTPRVALTPREKTAALQELIRSMTAVCHSLPSDQGLR